MSEEILTNVPDQDAEANEAEAENKDTKTDTTNRTDAKDKKPASSNKKKGPAKSGRYRTTTPFFVCGLIACLPVIGLVVLAYLRQKAKDVELKSYCEALILLRPIAFVLNLAVFIFLIMVYAKANGYI